MAGSRTSPGRWPGESALHFQAAPGAVVAQHRPDQLQADGNRHLRSVVETGEIGREEPGQTVALHRGPQAEVGQADDLRLTYGQAINAGVLGEGGHRLQVSR